LAFFCSNHNWDALHKRISLLEAENVKHQALIDALNAKVSSLRGRVYRGIDETPDAPATGSNKNPFTPF